MTVLPLCLSGVNRFIMWVLIFLRKCFILRMRERRVIMMRLPLVRFMIVVLFIVLVFVPGSRVPAVPWFRTCFIILSRVQIRVNKPSLVMRVIPL